MDAAITKLAAEQPQGPDDAMLMYLKNRIHNVGWADVTLVLRKARKWLGKRGFIDRNGVIADYSSNDWDPALKTRSPVLVKGNSALLMLLDERTGLDGHPVDDIEQYIEDHASSLVAWGAGGKCEVLVHPRIANGALARAWDKRLLETELGVRTKTRATLISHHNEGVNLFSEEDGEVKNLVADFAKPGIDPINLIWNKQLPEGDESH
jgi:hypothetical protein